MRISVEIIASAPPGRRPEATRVLRPYGLARRAVYGALRDAYRRQSKHKNLAPGTYLWIQESGGTQLKVLPPEGPPKK